MLAGPFVFAFFGKDFGQVGVCGRIPRVEFKGSSEDGFGLGVFRLDEKPFAVLDFLSGDRSLDGVRRCRP